MGDIRLDVDQMENLRAHLLTVGDDLRSGTSPQVPGAGLGFPSLQDSAVVFGDAHRERVTQAAAWCEKTADAVDYTAKFVGQTDEDVARDWAQRNSVLSTLPPGISPFTPGLVLAVPAQLARAHATGESSWSQIFTGNDHRDH
ncbi:MAG: hypothetical protein E7Z96_09815 [Actinomycetaceae bacterium]|nr:hypothetical protein [Actinomycetaceae bacterium]